VVDLKKVIFAALLATLLACAVTNAAAQTTTGRVQNNVLRVASQDSHLRMFSGAVDTAGLRDTLSGSGPYTIFAPIDDAFKNIRSPQMDAMSKGPAKMAALVKDHVITGKYTLKDLRNQGYVNTLNGKKLEVFSSDGAFALDGAHIIKGDIPVGNGIIHIIDTVMVPK
jgi:uncharacterized surface protein with fasciclin (FAS1) repeats